MEGELRVREALRAEFGQEFLEKRLRTGVNAGGMAAFKKFDAVSADETVIAMVKEYSAVNVVGNRTRLARVMYDLICLHEADADVKFMYLSAAFLRWFKETHDAVVPQDVEVRQIP